MFRNLITKKGEFICKHRPRNIFHLWWNDSLLNTYFVFFVNCLSLCLTRYETWQQNLLVRLLCTNWRILKFWILMNPRNWCQKEKNKTFINFWSSTSIVCMSNIFEKQWFLGFMIYPYMNIYMHLTRHKFQKYFVVMKNLEVLWLCCFSPYNYKGFNIQMKSYSNISA